MQVRLDHVTHAAMQLVCIEGDRFRRGRRMHSGNRGLTGRGAASPDPEHRRVSGKPSRRQRDMHIGHHMLRRLKRRNRAAELPARHRVIDRALQHSFADANQVQRQQCHPGIGHPAQVLIGQARAVRPGQHRMLIGHLDIVEADPERAVPAH